VLTHVDRATTDRCPNCDVIQSESTVEHHRAWR